MPTKNGASKGNGARKPKKLVEIDLTDSEPVEVVPAPRRRAPRLKEGDRVSRIEGKGSCGIVQTLAGKVVQVFWGRTDKRDVITWVPAIELKKETAKIVSAEEVALRQAERIGTPYRVEEE